MSHSLWCNVVDFKHSKQHAKIQCNLRPHKVFPMTCCIYLFTFKIIMAALNEFGVLMPIFVCLLLIDSWQQVMKKYKKLKKSPDYKIEDEHAAEAERTEEAETSFTVQPSHQGADLATQADNSDLAAMSDDLPAVTCADIPVIIVDDPQPSTSTNITPFTNQDDIIPPEKIVRK